MVSIKPGPRAGLCRRVAFSHFPLISLLAFVLPGCGWFSPPPPAQGEAGLPPEYLRSTITDPKLRGIADQFQPWVLERKAPDGALALYSKVQTLPVTQTVLPYGVGAYQQVSRWPVIVTTGPGWSKLTPDQKEKEVLQVYQDLTDRLRRASLDKELQPTLTLQTPTGILLSWINDTAPGRRLIHGDAD